MGLINPPNKVKPFAGLLVADLSLIEECQKVLEEYWGRSDLQSQIIHFDYSSYYNQEMGDKIYRLWLSFSNLTDPGELADWKIKSNQMEDVRAVGYSDKKYRRLNIDPGYLDDSKIVLATTKNYSHRIYLRDGIYAEVTLNYRKGRGWQASEWTYPDYKDTIGIDFFTKVRNEYLRQRVP